MVSTARSAFFDPKWTWPACTRAVIEALCQYVKIKNSPPPIKKGKETLFLYFLFFMKEFWPKRAPQMSEKACVCGERLDTQVHSGLALYTTYVYRHGTHSGCELEFDCALVHSHVAVWTLFSHGIQARQLTRRL